MFKPFITFKKKKLNYRYYIYNCYVWNINIIIFFFL